MHIKKTQYRNVLTEANEKSAIAILLSDVAEF